jgi:hypothetical protein
MTDQNATPGSGWGTEPPADRPSLPDETAPYAATPPVAPSTPPVEPAGSTDWARVEPVTPAGAAAGAQAAVASRQTSRGRWAVAIGALALIIIGTGAVLALVSGRSGATSELVGHMPASTTQYVEFRLDLPADQRAKFASFIQHFPGFQDSANLDQKVTEALDRLLGSATNGEQTYSKDIAPWFDGDIAIGTSQVATDATAQNDATAESGMAALAEQRVLVALTIKDSAAAVAYVDRVSEGSFTQSSYNGADLWLGEEKDGHRQAYASTGKLLFIGDEASVKEAIDTKGDGTLDSRPGMQATIDRARDSAGFMYQDLRASLTTMLSDLPGFDTSQTQIDDELLKLLPEYVSSTFRFENDAIALDSFQPRGELGANIANAHTALADHLPPTTFAAFEANDFGGGLLELVNRIRQLPEAKPAFDQIDPAIGLLGGWDGVLGWWGDTAVAFAKIGDDIGGGLVIAPKDAADARQLFDTIRSFIALGGQGQIDVKDENYKGVKISTIDVGALAQLGASMSGGGTEAPSIPPGTALISFAVADDVVVIGSGPSFVKAVIDAGAGQSLADDGRFQSLIGRVGAENVGWSYVDLTAARTLIEPLIREYAPEAAKTYETELKPYLEPFDALVGASKVEGDYLVGNSQVVVK